MSQHEDLQVLGAAVPPPAGEQARERTDHEGQEEEHRGIVEEPFLEARIEVSDPHGGWNGYRITRLCLRCAARRWRASVSPRARQVQRAEVSGDSGATSSRRVRSVHPGHTRLAVVSATRPPKCIERQTPR